MSIATSSKTNTAIATLAALGLSVAAGFGYWGIQNWNKFNSDYYKKGYAEETQQTTAMDMTTTANETVTEEPKPWETPSATNASDTTPLLSTTTNATTTQTIPE